MKLFIRWLINTVGIFSAAYLVRGIYIEDFPTAVVAAGVLGIINVLIRPILLLLTLPLNIVTLGLFTFILNGFIFYFIGNVVKGMAVANFWSAFLGAMIISIINGIAHIFFLSSHPEDKGKRD